MYSNAPCSTRPLRWAWAEIGSAISAPARSAMSMEAPRAVRVRDQPLGRQAVDLEAPRVRRVQVEFRSRHLVDVADDGEAPVVGERAHALGEQRAAHGVDGEVRALAFGLFHHGFGAISLRRF